MWLLSVKPPHVVSKWNWNPILFYESPCSYLAFLQKYLHFAHSYTFSHGMFRFSQGIFMAVQGCATTWCNLPFCTSSPRSAREVDFFARLYTIEYLYIYIHISTTLYIWLYMCIYIYSKHYIYIQYTIYIHVHFYLQFDVLLFVYSFGDRYCLYLFLLFIYISLFIAYTGFDIGFIIGECDWTMLWVAKRYDFLTWDFVKTWDINQASSERGYAEKLTHPFEQCMCYTSCAWTQTLCHHEGSAQITNR